MAENKVERDPDGKDPHEPGAKLDAGKPRVDLVFYGFPRALLAVAEVATFGAVKYSEHGWRAVEDGELRYRAAQGRHILAEGQEGPVDPETGLLHLAQNVWNGLAALELMLTSSELTLATARNAHIDFSVFREQP